jgi:hypothetical protein
MRDAAWFVDGRSIKDIGARLGISYKTVQTDRARLMRKLHLTNTTDLIRYAITNEADKTMPDPAQPTPPPVIAPAVVVPMLSAPVPITYRSPSVEREEWPG